MPGIERVVRSRADREKKGLDLGVADTPPAIGGFTLVFGLPCLAQLAAERDMVYTCASRQSSNPVERRSCNHSTEYANVRESRYFLVLLIFTRKCAGGSSDISKADCIVKSEILYKVNFIWFIICLFIIVQFGDIFTIIRALWNFLLM